MTIIVGQVPKLVGVNKGPGDLSGQLWHLVAKLAAVTGHGGTPEYHRTVQEAVSSARTGPAGASASDNRPPGRSDG